MFSSASCEWPTPPEVFSEIERRWGPFTLDAAANAEHAKCDHYYAIEHDGLEQPWIGSVFCNPPYGKGVIDRWVTKAIRSTKEGATVTMLVPARTSTIWFRELYEHSDELVAMSGNLKFGSACRSSLHTSSNTPASRHCASLLRHVQPETPEPEHSSSNTSQAHPARKNRTIW